jgi:hypothetical protein
METRISMPIKKRTKRFQNGPVTLKGTNLQVKAAPVPNPINTPVMDVVVAVE